MFTIEFFRVRDTDDAHAVLDRVEHDTADLEDAKTRAKSLFETLDMPQKRCSSGVRKAAEPEKRNRRPLGLLFIQTGPIGE